MPWALTVENFTLDGKSIANPLRSFIFNRNIKDHISGDDPDYSKPAGYETVRYPLSGLVGLNDIEKTKAHNAKYPNHDINTGLLNSNIISWLTSYIEVPQNGTVIRYETNVAQKYVDCLTAPNYTVFSNTSSMAEWNDNLAAGAHPVVALESPHNNIHLAVGGCDVPNYDRSPIPGANGDMGENDTAGLDPIFFLHHCFVDRVFWLWQKRHNATDELDIIKGYPGTNSVDSQGPTPGTAPNAWLDLDSPLDPFRNQDGHALTSRDVINIETQLGYTYGPGSLENLISASLAAAVPVQRVHVAGINRSAIRGSFLIAAYTVIDGTKTHLGTEAVLSRWHVSGCANCQTHLEARAAIPIPRLASGALQAAPIGVEVHTRDGLLAPHLLAGAARGAPARAAFRFEVR